jgi:hypothetical protein
MYRHSWIPFILAASSASARTATDALPPAEPAPISASSQVFVYGLSFDVPDQIVRSPSLDVREVGNASILTVALAMMPASDGDEMQAVVFELPRRAEIVGLTIDTGSGPTPAMLRSTAEARSSFERATGRRVDPGVLELTRRRADSDEYHLYVYPVRHDRPATATVTIRMPRTDALEVVVDLERIEHRAGRPIANPTPTDRELLQRGPVDELQSLYAEPAPRRSDQRSPRISSVAFGADDALQPGGALGIGGGWYGGGPSL